MFNPSFTKQDAFILIVLCLAGAGLAWLTLYFDPEVLGLRRWLEPMGIFVLALAEIAPQGSSKTDLNDVSFYGLTFAALLFIYWLALSAVVFPIRNTIVRCRDLDRRRRQKETADRLLGRDPDAYPLPEERGRGGKAPK